MTILNTELRVSGQLMYDSKENLILLHIGTNISNGTHLVLDGIEIKWFDSEYGREFITLLGDL